MLDSCHHCQRGDLGTKSPTPEPDFGCLFLRNRAQHMGPASPLQERGWAARRGDGCTPRPQSGLRQLPLDHFKSSPAWPLGLI